MPSGRITTKIAVPVLAIAFALPALADTIIGSKTYNFRNAHVADVDVQNIILHVDTLQVDVPKGEERKHFYITCQMQSSSRSSQQINYDIYFIIRDKSGNIIETVYAISQALFAQQIYPCGTDNGDRLPTTVGAVDSMSIQMTLAQVQHFDPAPLSPKP
jgi:hypothetical protein